jgi:hypothetical protein
VEVFPVACAALVLESVGQSAAASARPGDSLRRDRPWALASMALYMLNRDNPSYQDLPDWDRDANWHFFVPGPDGEEQHFRYPKIWEVGALASVAERTLERTLDDQPGEFGEDVTRILGSVFHLNLMPQIVAPLYEQATNKNSFTDAPIETAGMEDLQPFMRVKPGTSETMREMGMLTRDWPEEIQVNPVRAEALLRGYFNAFGMYGLALTDRAFFNERLPAMRADDMPVVRRFYQEDPPRHTKYEAMFYEMLEEARRLRGTMRALDDEGLTGLADDKQLHPLSTEAKPLERANKNVMSINREMREVRRSDLFPDDKRRRLDELTAERNALLKAAVQDSQRAQDGRK